MNYQKKLTDIAWQCQQYLVCLTRYFKLCFCTQGLINPVHSGQYYTESNIQKVSVFVLTYHLTKLYAFMVGMAHEYNSFTANNVRRFYVHGLLASQSPILLGKV